MPRFYIGHSEGDKEIWKASNVAAEANFLITVELSFAGQDPKPAERYKAALLALGKDATKRRPLSKYCWIFSLDSKLIEVFQTLVDHLGVEHHSYTAVDLKSGEGLSYDAEKRLVCEFYSKNWMA
ncbi:MAG: hypothetical protein HY525_16385 [Betaproteobacteria bacterium]|nr:hypothetical protein [Betaproteobacteria bacterium]